MKIRIVDVGPQDGVPEQADKNSAYRLLPNSDTMFYNERTDRNRGWITEEEQYALKHKVVGIAGCGGMGGLLASIFLRLGIGEVRIADCETFDVSNINRQFAATRTSLGKSKALETAKMVRDISDDNTVVVYPQGITQDTAGQFLEGCDIVCDEIEFWAVGARVLLHKTARSLGIPLLNCNTVGFGTRLFLFEPDGFSMEELLGLSYERATELQQKMQSHCATPEEIRIIMESVLKGLIPEIPEYSTETECYSTVQAGLDRLLTENRAPIIATNPPMAAGFLADHVLFQLLKSSTIKRNFILPPPAPGYIYFDAGLLQAKVVNRNTVHTCQI